MNSQQYLATTRPVCQGLLICGLLTSLVFLVSGIILPEWEQTQMCKRTRCRETLYALEFYYKNGNAARAYGFPDLQTPTNCVELAHSVAYYCQLLDCAEKNLASCYSPFERAAVDKMRQARIDSEDVFRFALDKDGSVLLDIWGRPFNVYHISDPTLASKTNLVEKAQIGDVVIWSCGQNGKNDWGMDDDVCYFPNLLMAEMEHRRERMEAAGIDPHEGMKEWLKEFDERQRLKHNNGE